jgi:hypothetical protein
MVWNFCFYKVNNPLNVKKSGKERSDMPDWLTPLRLAISASVITIFYGLYLTRGY